MTYPQVTLLFNDTRVFPPVTLSSDVQRHRLTSLTPGRLYKIVVSTFSGPNQRAQFTEGRTGETDQQLLCRAVTVLTNPNGCSVCSSS